MKARVCCILIEEHAKPQTLHPETELQPFAGHLSFLHWGALAFALVYGTVDVELNG